MGGVLDIKHVYRGGTGVYNEQSLVGSIVGNNFGGSHVEHIARGLIGAQDIKFDQCFAGAVDTISAIVTIIGTGAQAQEGRQDGCGKQGLTEHDIVPLAMLGVGNSYTR